MLLQVPQTKMLLATGVSSPIHLALGLWVYKGLSLFHALVNYFVFKKWTQADSSARREAKDHPTGQVLSSAVSIALSTSLPKPSPLHCPNPVPTPWPQEQGE